MTDLKDTLKVHASESQHWYSRDGEPCYTQTAKAGHERATTLRDARKLDLVPSVTTIIKCAAAPALDIWKQNQVLMAALTLPKEDGEDDETWCKRIMADSKEHAKQAAAKGTEIHAAIQASFEGIPQPEYNAYISGVENALYGWIPEPAQGMSEVAFAHPLGFGGKVDLVAFGNGAVVDYKTKEFGPEDDLKTWDEQAMQLAAYRMGLGLASSRCAILYVSVTHPGHAQLVEIPEEKLQRGWDMFYHLLNYWQASKNYDSGWEIA